MTRILGRVEVVTGEEIRLEERWSDRLLELVRYGPRGRRLAALVVAPEELKYLIDMITAAIAQLEVDARAAAAGTRTPGPPIAGGE